MILTALFDTKCIVSDAGLAWRRDSTAQHGSTSSRYSPSALHGSLLAACCLLLAACCLLLAACCLQSSVKRAETLTRHQQNAAIRLSRHQDWRNAGQDVQRRCWLLNTQSARNAQLGDL